MAIMRLQLKNDRGKMFFLSGATNVYSFRFSDYWCSQCHMTKTLLKDSSGVKMNLKVRIAPMETAPPSNWQCQFDNLLTKRKQIFFDYYFTHSIFCFNYHSNYHPVATLSALSDYFYLHCRQNYPTFAQNPNIPLLLLFSCITFCPT